MKGQRYLPIAHAISKLLVFEALMDDTKVPDGAQAYFEEALAILSEELKNQLVNGKVGDEVLQAAHLELNPDYKG